MTGSSNIVALYVLSFERLILALSTHALLNNLSVSSSSLLEHAASNHIVRQSIQMLIISSLISTRRCCPPCLKLTQLFLLPLKLNDTHGNAPLLSSSAGNLISLFSEYVFSTLRAVAVLLSEYRLTSVDGKPGTSRQSRILSSLEI